MIALKILDMLLRLYMLIVLAVVIIRVLQVTPNKWTNLLDRMTEPLLSPIRAQLNKHLPESWNAVDLSPLVLLLRTAATEETWVLGRAETQGGRGAADDLRRGYGVVAGVQLGR